MFNDEFFGHIVKVTLTHLLEAVADIAFDEFVVLVHKFGKRAVRMLGRCRRQRPGLGTRRNLFVCWRVESQKWTRV